MINVARSLLFPFELGSNVWSKLLFVGSACSTIANRFGLRMYLTIKINDITKDLESEKANEREMERSRG